MGKSIVLTALILTGCVKVHKTYFSPDTFTFKSADDHGVGAE